MQNKATEMILAGHLLSEQDLARRWSRSVRTLQRWRRDRYGPAYLRIGGSNFYRVEDVLAFEDSVRTEAVDD